MCELVGWKTEMGLCGVNTTAHVTGSDSLFYFLALDRLDKGKKRGTNHSPLDSSLVRRDLDLMHNAAHRITANVRSSPAPDT